MRIPIAVVIVGMLVATALVAFLPAPAAAKQETIHLYGSFAAGWGRDSPSAASNPGPTITLAAGDTVIVIIHSVDGEVHNWYLDLDLDQGRDGTEPVAPNVSGSALTQTPEFNAPAPGTYMYYCEYHQSTMKGQFIVESAGTTPSGGPDLTLALYAGIAVLIVVVALVAVMYTRGKRAGPKAPKPPQP